MLFIRYRLYNGKYVVGFELSAGRSYSDLVVIALLKRGFKIYGIKLKGDEIIGAGKSLSLLPRKQEINGTVLYHASDVQVKAPRWDYSSDEITNIFKDFGIGFYMCKTPKYPISLYSDRYIDGKKVYLNRYKCDFSGLRLLNLKDDIYWAMLVVAHRRDFSRHKLWYLLRDALRDSIVNCDVIIGTISDDLMFSVMNDFLRNRCSVNFVIECLLHMKYEKQYVLKSKKAENRIKFISHIEVGEDALQKSYRERTKSLENMEEVIETKFDNHRKQFRLAVESGNVDILKMLGLGFSDILDIWKTANCPTGDNLRQLLQGIRL